MSRRVAAKKSAAKPAAKAKPGPKAGGKSKLSDKVARKTFGEFVHSIHPKKPAKAAPKSKGGKPRARSEFGTIKGAPELASPLPFHPLANIFPLIEGREFEDLTASIKANGLRDAIIVHEGQVLDGRNRQNACIAAGVACRYELLPPDQDALKFVIDKNLRRRQLNDAQRASVAAKIANLGHGGDRSKSPDGALNDEQAADALNVARRQVTRARVVHEHGGEEVREALDRGDIPVATAEKISRLPKDQQPAAVEAAKPSGSRSIMSSRQEPDDSLDFFPTPPWATRALMEHVLPHVGPHTYAVQTAWDMACGEGHMAEVLREYFADVIATDVHDYGYESGTKLDFLGEQASPEFLGEAWHNWLITNPPFGDKTEAFVLRALELAKTGVAMFVRLQWLETIGRYERLFRDKPPTLIAFFCERVNLCKGRWEPDGATATAYIWLVWLKGEAPRAPFWIPPGCREGLTHADDAVRFTMHPVGGAVTEAATNIPENIPDPELTELQALETIEAGREIDIKLPIVADLKAQKLVRGSVKLKLTKLGMVQLEALRKEEYSKSDDPPGADRGDDDQVQEENISQVDCRVCSVGEGVCVECIATADHVATADESNGATCSCGWSMDAFDTPEGDLPAAIKAHWQNVVTEANAAAASVENSENQQERASGAESQRREPAFEMPDLPASLRRAPAEAAE